MSGSHNQSLERALAIVEAGKQFLDLLRAKSFPPYEGLLIRYEGNWLEARIELRPRGDGDV